MIVRTIIGASHAYACIEAPGFSLDVRLESGRSAAQSLRETSDDMRAQAADIIRRADHIARAADILEARS
jgi:hypothetical protein